MLPRAGTIVCQARKAYLPHEVFVKTYQQVQSLVVRHGISKLVFDKMSNMIHQSLLRKHGWPVATVVYENGPVALQALQAAAAAPPGSFPDVILLDLEMPAYDG